MPVLKLQVQDEEPLEDASEGFAGGQMSQGRRSRIGANQAHRLQNVMFWDATGRATTRRGTQQIGAETLPGTAATGLAYYDTAAVECLVRVRAGLVEKHANVDPGAAWTTLAGYTPTAGLPCEIVQGIADGDQVLFFSNGTDTPRTWDGAAFTSQATIPLGRAIGWFTNRLIVAAVASAPDTVFFSTLLDGATGYDSTLQLRIGAGDGDPIVTWRPWYGTIVAFFKRASVWLVDVNPATTVATMKIDRVNHARGLVAPRAVAEVGLDLWYLASDYRVASLGRYMEGGAEAAATVSAPVSNEIDQINRAAAGTASAVSYGSRFFLTVPGADVLVVYNTDLKVWEGYWDNWKPQCWAVSYAAGQHQLNFADDAGRVLRWREGNPETLETADDFLDRGWLGEAVQIRTSLETRNHTFGAALNSKRLLSAEIEFVPASALVANLWLIRDETVQPFWGAVDPGPGRVALNLLHELPGREFGLRIESPAGKLSVAAVRWSAFLDTVDLSAPAGFARPDVGGAWTPIAAPPASAPVAMPDASFDGAGEFSGTMTVAAALPAVSFDGAGDFDILGYYGWQFLSEDYVEAATETYSAAGWGYLDETYETEAEEAFSASDWESFSED